jgi:hypothetical protein
MFCSFITNRPPKMVEVERDTIEFKKIVRVIGSVSFLEFQRVDKPLMKCVTGLQGSRRHCSHIFPTKKRSFMSATFDKIRYK